MDTPWLADRAGLYLAQHGVKINFRLILDNHESPGWVFLLGVEGKDMHGMHVGACAPNCIMMSGPLVIKTTLNTTLPEFLHMRC